MQKHDSQGPEGTRGELSIEDRLAAGIDFLVGTLNFTGWMAAVDNEISALAGGLTSSDLPDAAHRDAFDAGVDPLQWAGEVLLEAGFGDEFDDFIMEMMEDE